MSSKNEDAKPSLDEWVSSFYGIFGNADRQKTIADLCIRTARDVNAMFTAERRGELVIVYQGLAQVFCDLCMILGKCQDHSPQNRIPKVLSRSKKFSKLVWSRYPAVCPYCASVPCDCSTSRIEIEIAQRRERHTLEFHRKETQRPRTLDDWIRLADSIYGPTIYPQTIRDLIGRLMEETIELLATVSSIDREQQKVDHAFPYTTTDFDNDLAAIFMTMCLVALKLGSFLERRFSLIVKRVFGNAEKKVVRIQNLQRLDFQTTTPKGRILEEVAEQTFGMVPDFEVLKHKRTDTGEIDRIIRNKSHDPFLRSLGTHILVECKSSIHRVSKKEVVDFIDKLRSHRCKCGVLVTLSGVSGKPDRDAKGKIKEAFVRNGLILMTFAVEDLQRIQVREDPVRIFYEKCESVQFM